MGVVPLPRDVRYGISLNADELIEAILGGWKDVENRHVALRGWYALHRSCSKADPQMVKVMHQLIPDLAGVVAHATLPRGAVVGLAYIEDSIKLQDSCKIIG